MRIFSTLVLTLFLAQAWGRIGRKELNTDSGTVVLHHFKAGGISTKEWTEKGGRRDRSRAYKHNGEVIFHGRTRSAGGHASVCFSHHPGGGVRKVETSDAPDGGIQWYKSTTTFDEDGYRTGFGEHGRDDHGPIPRITVEPGHVPGRPDLPYPKEHVREQRMFLNELFVVNTTNAAVRVVATPKDPSPGMPGGTWSMVPGDTVRIGSFGKGESTPEWKTAVDLSIVRMVPGDRNKAVARIRNEERSLSEEHRQVHVVIEGWTTTKDAVGPEALPTPNAPPARKEEKKTRARSRLRFR